MVHFACHCFFSAGFENSNSCFSSDCRAVRSDPQRFEKDSSEHGVLRNRGVYNRFTDFKLRQFNDIATEV